MDAPEHSEALIRRLGLEFPLASDPDQAVVKSFGVQNPETQELALHAVYILDPGGRIYYRKVGRRRPTSEELLDAIDAFHGVYPVKEQRKPRPPRSVAWPQNNFQTLLEMTAVSEPPAAIDLMALGAVLKLMAEGKTDDSLIAFKRFAGQHADNRGDSARADLMLAAAWLARQRFIEGKPEVLRAGQDLTQRLRRVDELETALANATNPDERDQLLQTLGKARGGLSRARAVVRNGQAEWNLDYAQGMLRSYREVGRVMSADQ